MPRFSRSQVAHDLYEYVNLHHAKAAVAGDPAHQAVVDAFCGFLVQHNLAEHCGGCGGTHPVGYAGDCRDDRYRL